MKPNKIVITLLACMCIFLFTACESSLQTIVGEYSFKVSGQVVQDGTTGLPLPDEIGVMEIIDLHDGNLLLTFNTVNGSVYTTHAALSDNQLDLQPFTRTVSITIKKQDSTILGGLIEHTEVEHYNTEVYGYGTIHGETIEFTLQYSGMELSGNKRIKGNQITMLAKKN